MWYDNSYRRHLCDMHIHDWDEAFLSRFSPEAYFENLKRAKVQSAMIYFQSHVGLCYYPTKSGKMHNAFRGKEDAMRRLVNMCRENGIHVTGYYSLIYNNWAHDTHPEWRLVNQDGRSAKEASEKISAEFAQDSVCRYGLCCPNNVDYRAFVEKQIQEMAEYFTFDGMFFDMLFWLHPCYCPSCQKRWEEEVGGRLPTVEDWQDPMWLLHMQKRREWMGEFAQFATDTLKKYAPHSTVEHNVSSAGLPLAHKGNAEEVLKASEFAGGDLYGGIYNQSFICKLYKNFTTNPPFEYMASRCTPTLAHHTTSKSEDTLKSEVFLTAAHHGATLVIDAINPVGTLDQRVYDMFGRIFAQQEPYETYFKGDMVEDVGVYYSLRSKFNAHGEAYTNHDSCVHTVKNLVQNHISCGVTGTLHSLNDYQILIAPMLTEIDALDFGRIIQYVKDGGQLYLSGSDCTDLLKEFFGLQVVDRTVHKIVYVAPKSKANDAFAPFNAEYPLHIDGTAPIIDGAMDEAVLATITLPYTLQGSTDFASIHSDPPGVPTDIPAVMFTTYGKGKVLWSSVALEGIDNYNHERVLINLLEKYFTLHRSFISDAPVDVEVTLFQKQKEKYVHLVLLNEQEKARKIAPICVSVASEKKPTRILQLPNRIVVPFSYDGGYVAFREENMEMFRMYKIEME